MGVISTHTMVTGTTSSGFVGYFTSLSTGSMSPSTSDAIGTSPSILELYYAFGFTVIKFSGYFDNSSITGLRLTPSGGSTFTMSFGSFSRDQGDNYTIFSDGSGSTLLNNTNYTVEILGDTTDVNTEATTLERRTPTGLDDFFGATRNVQPISGVMKLSYLHDAVKYQWTTSMTAGFFYDSFNGYNYHGYGGVYPSMGSMGSTAPSGILNLYNGKTIINLYNLNTSGTNYVTLAFQTSTDGSIPGSNSQWYKLQVGSAAFYREDATFSYNTSSPYFTVFTWNTGSTQHISNGNTYTIKLTC